jgi:hypothetical protein
MDKGILLVGGVPIQTDRMMAWDIKHRYSTRQQQGHFIIIESTLKTHQKASIIATVVRNDQKK